MPTPLLLMNCTGGGRKRSDPKRAMTKSGIVIRAEYFRRSVFPDQEYIVGFTLIFRPMPGEP